MIPASAKPAEYSTEMIQLLVTLPGENRQVQSSANIWGHFGHNECCQDVGVANRIVNQTMARPNQCTAFLELCSQDRVVQHCCIDLPETHFGFPFQPPRPLVSLLSFKIQQQQR